MSEKFSIIPIDLLEYSGRNPRTEMRSLEEFAENIKEYGVLEPIIVRPKEEKFEVVVGERRVRASIIAGLKEIPAIIRAITDRQADELRLIENIHREDLTDAEKGDAVYSILENYPEKYPHLKAISDSFKVPKDTIKRWCQHSRRLSDHVKRAVESDRIVEAQASYLLKYDHLSQERLLDAIAKNELNLLETAKFVKLYDANPKADLDDLANEVKGIKRVRVPLEELSEESRKEIEQLLQEKKKKLGEVREKARRKATEASSKARKERAERKKTEKKPKPPPPLLPEEKERLEEVRARETRKILEERKKKAEFMKTKAEITEMEVEIPKKLSEEYRKWIEKTERKEIEERNKLNDLTSTEDWVKFTKTWFIHNPPPRKPGEMLHPSKFPETLIAEFIGFFTKKGQIVLDPLLGTGSTLVACDMTERIGIGIELEEQWAKIARTRTKQTIILGDSRNIDKMNIPQVDFVITSPPYWNQLKRASIRQEERSELGIPTEYSDDESNIGNIDDYEKFVEEQREILDKVYDVVKPGGYMVVITNNVFFDGRLYPLAFDTAISLSRSRRWILKDEKIWLQDNKRLLPLGVFNAWVGNRCHEYCLIFRKEA